MRTTSSARAVPSAHAVRGELRSLRRTRQARSWRQRAADIYGALLTVGILGGMAVQAVLRLLQVGLAPRRGHPIFGMALPVNLARQLLRGPFLAGVLAAVQILLAG